MAENSHEVGQPAAVPQQHLVVDVLGVPDILHLALQRKEIHKFKLVGGVGGAVG